LNIKFPTVPKFDFDVKPADDNLRRLVPATDKKLSSLVIRLKDYPEVDGFGMPFANRGHPSEGVVNRGECIIGNITLMDMILRLEFNFIVAAPELILFKQLDARIPAPFRYPYGEDHFWSVERYEEMLPETKGHQFKPSWSFDNDNEHLAALTQSQVQDVMWIHKASQKIAEAMFRAYFVKPLSCPPAECSIFYAIITMDKNSLRSEDAWYTLIKSGYLRLCLYDSEEDEYPAKWEARVQEAPKTLDILTGHAVDRSDLVLQVRRPKPTQHTRRPDFDVKVYGDRRAANNALDQNVENWTCVSLEFDDLLRNYERRVNAINSFCPHAEPSNPISCGISKGVVDRAAKTNRRPPISSVLQFKMSLHRDMLRGQGFWKTLVSGTVNGDRPQLQRRLPRVNLIDIPRDHLEALFAEVLAEDRYRFMKYLSQLCLGLGLISAVCSFHDL
jgi:hypothetical protein